MLFRSLNMYCGVPFVKLSVFNLSAERSERGGALARPPYSHRHGMVSRRMLHGDGCATESKEQENRDCAIDTTAPNGVVSSLHA